MSMLHCRPGEIMSMRVPLLLLVVLTGPAAAAEMHNVILFVADGMRAGMATREHAPAMSKLRSDGVRFAKSHAIFPTFTTLNASVLATGHLPGDTGDFSNIIYTGYPVAPAKNTVTPFLENDSVLADVDEHFGGDYLNEDTILKLARGKGLSTAAVGKLGPTLIFDHTREGRERTIVIDDVTGSQGGIPLSEEVKEALAQAGIEAKAPERGANGKAGDANTPGTSVANVVQQDYFVKVLTDAILPMFKKREKAFLIVFWSRDPDGTQHNQGDSHFALTPGINGPTSLAAIRNADDNLARIRDAVEGLGLAASTNIILTSDHGFATISKESATSPSALATYQGVPAGQLPPGFLAIDISRALGLPLFDPNDGNRKLAIGERPKAGNGLVGNDPASPSVVVAANGGSDLLYLPGNDRALARRIVGFLASQDYTSGIFVDDRLGSYGGSLPHSAIGLRGSARTPRPSIVVSFRTFATGCAEPTTCAVEVADTALQQGQGMHGTFSRADTFIAMGAVGPDFKRTFVDPAPVSNADIGVTIAKILGLNPSPRGSLLGRVVSEAFPGGTVPNVDKLTLRSAAAYTGEQTVLEGERVGAFRYIDAAGFPGRTIGLTGTEISQR
jgi:Type I phosphodiesterase / nucleotide pyrophosphatase